MEREDRIDAESTEQPSPLGPHARSPAAPASPVTGPSRLLRSRIAWQAAGFAGGSLLANAFAVVATALLTRNLGTSEFGSYAFGVSLLFFVALFFEFGLFFPAARVAAVANGREQREVVGAALLLYIPVGAAFSLTVFGLSFWVDDLFHVEAGHALRVVAGAAFAFPFVIVLQQLAQGVDRLHIASAATATAQGLLVALLALYLSLGGGLSATTSLLLRSFALLLASTAAAIWLRPVFGAAQRWMRELVRQAREYGFQVFVGRVLSIGTYNMDVLLLGLWTSSRSVGLYALAGSLALASGLPVTGMASALFAQMARAPVISRRWLMVATFVGAACALAVWLLAEPVIRIFFSARYVAAASLILPLALAQFVRGITGVYNAFLSAHGRGRELRNAGLVLTLSNLVFNFALIPPFGAKGAAWASLLALAANLLAHAMFYRSAYGRQAELSGPP
jgi:O-antigen/teichoic acid export membrane protein